MNHLSLFTGIGGLDIAAEWAGFETVGQCEWADYPTKVLEKHWPDVPRWRDIRSVTKESFYERTGLHTADIISGGFPCQPFSVAGNQKGKEDDRYLWPEMLRVIRELTPRWVIGENVPGIIKLAGKTVCEDLEREGYAVTVFNFEAAAVGAPHRRERVFFVGHAKHYGLSSITELRSNETSSDQRRQEKPYETRQFKRTGGSLDVPSVHGSATGIQCEASIFGESNEDEVRKSNADFAERSSCASPFDVADSHNTGDGTPRRSFDRNRQEIVSERADQPQPRACGCGEDVSHSQCAGLERHNDGSRSSQQAETVGADFRAEDIGHGGSIWSVEPNVGRVANGIPSRVDRLKCLGNAVVPQQAYPIFKAIAEVEEKALQDGSHELFGEVQG